MPSWQAANTARAAGCFGKVSGARAAPKPLPGTLARLARLAARMPTELSGGQGPVGACCGCRRGSAGMFLAMGCWQRKADTTTTPRPAAGNPAYARLFPLQPPGRISLDSILELCETLVIGIQTFQIRIIHRP